MKKLIVLGVIIFSAAISFSGCYYDKEDLVYPRTSCDTANITYSSSIVNILETHCFVCHRDNNASGANGIKLDTYDALKAEAESGELMHRLTTTDASIMMPQGGPRLSDCEISKFATWIKLGTPQ